MNLYTNIKFSNNLIGNKICTITYSGYLYENNAQAVRIVYGYGNEWQHTTEQLMEKTEHGFEAQINVLDYDTFNFCFRNEVYEWDNNYNQNYTAPISKDIPQEEVETEENFIINEENVLPEILDNLSSIDLSSTTPEIDENEIIEKTENINNVEIQNISEEPVSPISFDVFFEKNEPVNIEESLVNSVEIETLNQDLDSLFEEIYNTNTSLEQISETTPVEQTEVVHFNTISVVDEVNSSEEHISEIETNNEETQSSEIIFENDDVEYDDIITNHFNMNNLIDEILSPIVNSSVFEEESLNSLQEFSTTENLFEAFEEVDDDVDVDNKIDTLIADLFNNTKEFAKQTEPIETVSSITQTEETPISFIEETTNEINEVTTFENTQNIETTNEETIENTSSNESITENDLFEAALENEDSLINSLEESTALVEVSNDNDFVVSPRSLGKFYMFRKKVKLIFAKLFSLPKLFGRNFNRGTN